MNLFVFPPEEIDKLRLSVYDGIMERINRTMPELVPIEFKVHNIDESVPWTPVEKAFVDAMDMLNALWSSRDYYHPDGDSFDPIFETTDEYAAEHGLDQIPIQRPKKDLNG